MTATLRDCVYGMAVGDALGVPYEFRPRGTFECIGMIGHGTHGQPAGTWSDDTSMALALCDSYRELGRVDCGDVRALRPLVARGRLHGGRPLRHRRRDGARPLLWARLHRGEQQGQRLAHALSAHGVHGLRRR